MSSSPGVASIARPFTVIVTVVRITSVMRTPALVHVLDEVVAKHLDRRVHRRRYGGPQHADRRLLGRPGEARRDVVTEVVQQVDVLQATAAVFNAVHRALDPTGALPTRRALTARLTREELRDAPRRTHDARRLVHDDDRTRAEHRTLLGDLVLSEGQVELVGSEPRRRDTSRDDRLDPLVVDDAAAELGVVDEITERVLHHLDLEDAGIVDAPGEREEPRARRASAAERRECRTAVIDDSRQIG